jgi:hypothetical protein
LLEVVELVRELLCPGTEALDGLCTRAAASHGDAGHQAHGEHRGDQPMEASVRALGRSCGVQTGDDEAWGELRRGVVTHDGDQSTTPGDYITIALQSGDGSSQGRHRPSGSLRPDGHSHSIVPGGLEVMS